MISNKQTDRIIQALNAFHIELPSWGFANTGTRFGKFLQPAAATSTAEKFADAGQVHRVTGVCPTIALHVLWDLPKGLGDCAEVQALAAEHGLRPGSINPNVFQDQNYKYGSHGWAIPIRPSVRRLSTTFWIPSKFKSRLGSRDISLWFADGSSYPGTQNIRHRRRWFRRRPGRPPHAALAEGQRMMQEYKPLRALPSITPTSPIGAWRSNPLAGRRT